MYVPKLVYVVNAGANRVDSWTCFAEMRATFDGKPETLCLLRKGRRSCALPKRCVFETEEGARAVLNTRA